MNKAYLIILTLCLLVGCSSPGKKAKNLIEEDLRTSLHDFSSYEMVSFSPLDSTFSDFTDTPQGDSIFTYFITASKLATESLEKGNEYSEKADYTFSNTYKRSYLESAIKHYEDAKMYSSLTKTIKRELDSLMDVFTPQFNGWKMEHSYRAKTLSGNYKLTRYLYFFDPEVKKIIRSKNLSDDK